MNGKNQFDLVSVGLFTSGWLLTLPSACDLYSFLTCWIHRNTCTVHDIFDFLQKNAAIPTHIHRERFCVFPDRWWDLSSYWISSIALRISYTNWGLLLGNADVEKISFLGPKFPAISPAFLANTLKSWSLQATSTSVEFNVIILDVQVFVPNFKPYEPKIHILVPINFWWRDFKIVCLN